MVGGRVSTNQFATAKWIVDTNGLSAGATHSTITSALSDAVSGENIFVKPGTYTENLTLKAGVNLTAFECDPYTPTVTIVGKCSFTATGTANISNIRLETNGDYALAITGSNASVMTLFNCFINCTDNTGINFASSSAGARLRLTDCISDVGTTGISTYTHSAGGDLRLRNCYLLNSGSSVTANAQTNGTFEMANSVTFMPISTSGASANGYNINNSRVVTFGTSAVAVTHNSTGGGVFFVNNTRILSGSGASISVGASAFLHASNVFLTSSAANNVTGSGTFRGGCVNLFNTLTMNPSTNTPLFQTTIHTDGISFDSGSNTLANYEEGTFSPTIGNTGSAPSVTYDLQLGRYTRVGDRVMVNIYIDLATYTAGTGNARITSLPFTSDATSNNQHQATMVLDDVTAGASVLYYQGTITASTTVMPFSGIRSANTTLGLAASGVAATSLFRTSFVYEV